MDEASSRACHADLRVGSTGTSYETRDICLFDSGAYYVHNEMEIGDWRRPYNKVNSKIYTKTYPKIWGMSEPAERNDRNQIYSEYSDLIYSCIHMMQGRSVQQM